MRKAVGTVQASLRRFSSRRSLARIRPATRVKHVAGPRRLAYCAARFQLLEVRRHVDHRRSIDGVKVRDQEVSAVDASQAREVDRELVRPSLTVAGAVLTTVIVDAMAWLVVFGTCRNPEPLASTVEDGGPPVSYPADS